MNTASIHTVRHNLALRAAALLPALCALAAVPAARAEPSNVDALFNFEVSDKYLTPRGMDVVDHGATFQTLLLGLVNLYKDKDSFVSDITFVPGVWADFATHPTPIHASGPGVTEWVETDPIAGLSFGFAKNLKLDVTYTAFEMHILDIGTSQHMETKLSYDDSGLLGDLALHPYVSYWKELVGKATAAANFGVPSSYYFEVGIAPAANAGKLKFEAPVRVLLPDTNFYGNHFGPASTVGLYEFGLKASTPAGFMPAGYGHWSFHIGYRYMDFNDVNLQHLANGGGFGAPIKGMGQIYSGMTSFF